MDSWLKAALFDAASRWYPAFGRWIIHFPVARLWLLCMPRSHRWHRTVAVPLCHYYMQLQPTRTHRPGSLPVGAGGYPTAAHAESMPTAPPANPGPVLRKINRGRWAAHCSAAAAARSLTWMPQTRGSARVVLGASETGHHPVGFRVRVPGGTCRLLLVLVSCWWQLHLGVCRPASHLTSNTAAAAPT